MQHHVCLMRFKKYAFYPDFQGLILMVPRKLKKKGQEKKSGPPPITFNWWGLMNQKKNWELEGSESFWFCISPRKKLHTDDKTGKRTGKKKEKKWSPSFNTKKWLKIYLFPSKKVVTQFLHSKVTKNYISLIFFSKNQFITDTESFFVT